LEIIEKKIIKDKRIFIFEKHNEAIIPWNIISKESRSIPSLLTFDYHTDTHLALLMDTYKRLNGAEHTLIKKEVENILSKPFEIFEILKKLKNDEHIDFAIRTNIISHAYVISYQAHENIIRSKEYKKWFKENTSIEAIVSGLNIPKPEDIKYILPENKIFELDNDIFSDLKIDTEKQERNFAIEHLNLIYKINTIKKINKSIFGENYNFRENFILDIDLDYFNTYKSINPEHTNVFYSLIRDAKVITIAKESWFVNKLKFKNEDISVDYLLKRLLEHIEKALK